MLLRARVLPHSLQRRQSLLLLYKEVRDVLATNKIETLYPFAALVQHGGDIKNNTAELSAVLRDFELLCRGLVAATTGDEEAAEAEQCEGGRLGDRVGEDNFSQANTAGVTAIGDEF